MLEIKIFVEKDAEKYKALMDFLTANEYVFSTMPVLPQLYLNKRFSPPFRLGKKQRRVVLDSQGLEVFIAPKGKEKMAALYCDSLNKEMPV